MAERREEMTAAIMEIRRREKLYLALKEYVIFVYAANTGKTAVKWIHHFLCMLLLIELDILYMFSILLWST